MRHHLARLGSLALVAGISSVPAQRTEAHTSSFLRELADTPSISADVVADNGDQNPYGVAVVPARFCKRCALDAGDVLVSDFNDSTAAGNDQATGRSIVRVTPKGDSSTFFTAPDDLGLVGLTTALVALRSGIVVVGNTPRVDTTTPPTVSNGSLLFIDGNANLLFALSDSALLQGPWDMTADESDPDDPVLYVSNVLSGTVTRIDLHVAPGDAPTPIIGSLTTVASGFAHRTDPAALVVGPTGLVLTDDNRDLFVADTGNNRIQLVRGVCDARRDRGSGTTVFSGLPLNGPLGLARAPNGNLVAANGDAVIPQGPDAPPPNLVVEIDPSTGSFVAKRQLDTGTLGALFGIAIARESGKSTLLYVDDNDNTLNFLPKR